MNTTLNNVHDSIEDLPSRVGLELVLAALARELPQAFKVLVDADELSSGRDALESLTEPGCCARVAASLNDTEARWMSERLLHAWAQIGTPLLGSNACLIAPREVWISDGQVNVPVEVICVGLVEGWQALWPDTVTVESSNDNRCIASFSLPAPVGTAPIKHSLNVRVVGHALNIDGEQGKRDMLLANAEITVRRPMVSVRADGLSLCLTDQTNAVATDVVMKINELEVTTDSNGIVQLDEPVVASAIILVAGTAVNSNQLVFEAKDGIS